MIFHRKFHLFNSFVRYFLFRNSRCKIRPCRYCSCSFVTCATYPGQLHCKKKGTFWNLKKRFGGLQKVCKCVESSKKRIKKNSEPLKDLTVCPGEDPFFFETFLSSVDQKKGFVGKYETFRVSY